jgi:Mn2+/Fe2+ NRAMP family transporter
VASRRLPASLGSSTRSDEARSSPDAKRSELDRDDIPSAIRLLLSLAAAVAALLAPVATLSGSPLALSALLTVPLTMLAALILLLAVLFSRLLS